MSAHDLLLLKDDLLAYDGGRFSLKGTIKTLLLRPGFHVTVLYRLSHSLFCLGMVGYIPARILWYLTLLLYGCDISLQARVGGGLRLPHPHGIIIGDGVRVGRRVTIMQNVTLGSRETHVSLIDNYMLRLKDSAFIGAGAVVLGNIIIGENALVGANAVVISSVPDGHSAIGVPAKTRRRKA